MLKVAEPNKRYALQTDASEQGLGAVLSQIGENREEHPVAFASRKFLQREKNYSVIEEYLAIVWSLQVFHVYFVTSTLAKQSGKSNILIYSKLIKFQASPKFRLQYSLPACCKTQLRYVQASRFFTGNVQSHWIYEFPDPLKVPPLHHLATF